MGTYDLADGPHKRHIELFAEFKAARGYKRTCGLMAARVRISAALADEEDCSGFGEEALRPLLDRAEGESESTREKRVEPYRFLGHGDFRMREALLVLNLKLPHFR